MKISLSLPTGVDISKLRIVSPGAKPPDAIPRPIPALPSPPGTALSATSPLTGAANGGPRLGFMGPPQVHPAQPIATATSGRRKHRIPAISLGAGLVSRYEAEKIYGMRRENGALKLKKLTRKHYEIIARHLAGQSGERIHNEMNLSVVTISRVLNDPLAQQVIKRSYKDRQSELDALAGMAIGAVRDTLTVGSTSEKLAAVDKFTKLKQAIAPETNPAESAEDFAKAIITNAQNVQINIGTRP